MEYVQILAQGSDICTLVNGGVLKLCYVAYFLISLIALKASSILPMVEL